MNIRQGSDGVVSWSQSTEAGILGHEGHGGSGCRSGLSMWTEDQGQHPEPRKAEWAADRAACRDIGTRQSLHDRTGRKCLACSRAQGPGLGQREPGRTHNHGTMHECWRPTSVLLQTLSWGRVPSRAEAVSGGRASPSADTGLQDQDSWGDRGLPCPGKTAWPPGSGCLLGPPGSSA